MPRRQRAVAMIRRDLQGLGADVHEVAEQHGFRVVHTLYLDTGPLLSALIVTGAVSEHDAAAVAVPALEHADAVRYAITEHSALATPLCLYPKGYRWPVVER